MKSNCLIEAIKAFLKNPRTTKIRISSQHPFPYHYYWEKNGKAYWYGSNNKNEPWYGVLWYEGKYYSRRKG